MGGSRAWVERRDRVLARATSVARDRGRASRDEVLVSHHAVRSGRFSDARRHGDVVVDSEHAANGVRGVGVRARRVASRLIASRSFVRCAGARGKTGMRTAEDAAEAGEREARRPRRLTRETGGSNDA